jgi:hypothetical protein
MKAVKILLIIVVIIWLTNWVWTGNDFPLFQVVSLFGDSGKQIFTVAAFIMIAITVIGILRLYRRSEDCVSENNWDYEGIKQDKNTNNGNDDWEDGDDYDE